MFLPRSTFQLAALCLTLFSSLVWFSSSHISSSSAFEKDVRPHEFFQGNRAPAPAPCHVQTEAHNNIVVDEPADDPIWDIQNRTLGFQKIYAVSMPHRIDKRDFLGLMSLTTDLDIEFVDGVVTSEMDPKALPVVFNGENGTGTIGCWRAHINIYQTMVRDRIQSALVLEDDADWDVLIKAQMTEFARGTRHLQKAQLPMHSPYGDNWDLLTVGNIGTNNFPNREQDYWLVKDDPTVIAEVRRRWSRKPDLSAPQLGGNHTRVIHAVSKFAATHAYAVSLRGAARLLYDQTMLPHAQAIDMAMLQLCRHDYWGPTPFCLGAHPMIFGRFRPAGPKEKDSDRRVATNDDAPGLEVTKTGERTKHESEFTVFPVSLNIEKLLKNDPIIPAQYPQVDMVPEIDLSQFVFPKGEPAFVRPDEYVNRQPKPEDVLAVPAIPDVV